MPALASLEQLKMAERHINTFKRYRSFYSYLVHILNMNREYGFRNGFVCRLILNEKTGRYAPGISKEKEKQHIISELRKLEKNNYKTFKSFSRFLNDYRHVGYNNICSMIMGTKPEKLKQITPEEEIHPLIEKMLKNSQNAPAL